MKGTVIVLIVIVTLYYLGKFAISEGNRFTSIVIISPFAYVEPICKKNNLDDKHYTIPQLTHNLFQNF